jgi:hypothetical protein
MPGKIYGLDLIRSICDVYLEIPILNLFGQKALYNIKNMMAEIGTGYQHKNAKDEEMKAHAIEQVYIEHCFLSPL